jgi:ferritin-like metal-binding protein YciE
MAGLRRAQRQSQCRSPTSRTCTSPNCQIAAYGTVAALAGELDLRDDQQMLHESLEEEKQADLRLTKVAKSEVNPDALARADEVIE